MLLNRATQHTLSGTNLLQAAPEPFDLSLPDNNFRCWQLEPAARGRHCAFLVSRLPAARRLPLSPLVGRAVLATSSVPHNPGSKPGPPRFFFLARLLRSAYWWAFLSRCFALVHFDKRMNGTRRETLRYAELIPVRETGGGNRDIGTKPCRRYSLTGDVNITS